MISNKYPDNDSAIDGIGIACISWAVIIIIGILYLLYSIGSYILTSIDNFFGG